MRLNLRWLCLAVLVVSAPVMAAAGEGVTLPRWDQDTVELFASLPVQAGGRIKPLDTYAQFAMLKINGKRTFRTEGGLKIGPTEWIMYCLFFPEVTDTWKQFIVDRAEVVSAIGLTTHDKRRDRYAYSELKPGRQKLMELATQYQRKEARQRAPMEQQVINLAYNLREYESISQFMYFSTVHFHPDPEGRIGKALGVQEEGHATLSLMLQRVPALLSRMSTDKSLSDTERRELSDILHKMEKSVATAGTLSLFPPTDPEKKEWYSPADLLVAAFEPGHDLDTQFKLLGHLERLKALRDDPIAFHQEVLALHGGLKALAEARGEYAKIGVERAFYRGKYLFFSQWLYVLSFVLVALSWLVPQSKWLQRLIPPAVLAPTILLIIAIAFRCIIRGRPPVTTLYETLLFITASSALVAVIIEYINRQRIAVALGSIMGTLGMFLAYRYELKEGVDTMPSLVAVLDTNFWLASHVTTVTLGYAAGLLAAALAHVYILGKLFGLKRGDEAYYASVDRMIYGVVCFSLLFSLVGTVLGGIWANDSWGRFWGWDPKENGALMICLWALVMLHARLGHYIKDLGTAITSVVLGMIVTFSWWGVNLLGVGLHSYGFTSGILRLLVAFWSVETVVIILGFVVGQMDRMSASSSPGDQKTA